MSLKEMKTPDLRKKKREIDNKLYSLGNLKFDETEVIEKKIKQDLADLSMALQVEIESRKRKKKNGK